MQVFNRKCVRLLEDAGLRIALYTRYMDDGRKFLQPVMNGLRWIGGALEYSLQLEDEDEKRSPLDMTVGVLKETARGIADYLSFTFETTRMGGSQRWTPALE